MSNARLMQGSEAVCEGAIAAGVRFFAGYPITPATEIVEKMSEMLPKVGGKFIQMEDEIASMGAACGASLASVKSITATSGPGFSLKQEMIGYASMTEIPVTIVDVQRMGPSTGNIFAGQGDVMQARWGASGDRGVIALSPSTVRECYELTIQAVNWSEKYRTPVVLLLDEIIAHMRERVELPDEAIPLVERKRPTGEKADFQPYHPDEDGVCPMAEYGSGYYSHITGLMHDENGMPNNDAPVADKLVRRLNTKILDHRREIELYKTYMTEDAEYLMISFGCSARACRKAVRMARAKGIKVGLLTLITIWPFPAEVVAELAAKCKKVLVVEMNLGQLICEIQRHVDNSKLLSATSVDGELFDPEQLIDKLLNEEGGATVCL